MSFSATPAQQSSRSIFTIRIRLYQRSQRFGNYRAAREEAGLSSPAPRAKKRCPISGNWERKLGTDGKFTHSENLHSLVKAEFQWRLPHESNLEEFMVLFGSGV